MDRIDRISELFTEHCSIAMPAENYLFIYKRMQELECERDYYKQQADTLKQAADKLKEDCGIDLTNFV